MPDTTTSTLILQSIVTVAAGSTAAATVTAIVSRRKTSAEVTKTKAETGRTEAEIVGVGSTAAATQVDTAMDMLREVRVDMGVLRSELGTARSEITSLQQWKGRHERLMDEHGRWDEAVYAVLRERDIDIGPPPPLRAE